MSACKKICAGIVLYNPDLKRLMDNIDNIVAQVDKVFLVDNGSVNIKQVKQLHEYSEKVSLICNARNMGIAMALNQLANEAKGQGYTWILTLDQDSVCQPKLIDTYEKYIGMPNVGILTCNIIDRNFGVESYTKKAEYEECNFCITSGALLNINAWEKVGGFDNKMFIDKVDYDLCLSMRERGIKIVRVNYNGLLHEIGHAKKINIGKIHLIFLIMAHLEGIILLATLFIVPKSTRA